MAGKNSLPATQSSFITELSASEQQFVDEIKGLIRDGQRSAAAAANYAAVKTYRSIGKRIFEQEQDRNARAEYGTCLLKILSENLTAEYGKNYSARNLRYFRQFYRYFPKHEGL